LATWLFFFFKEFVEEFGGEISYACSSFLFLAEFVAFFVVLFGFGEFFLGLV